MNRDQKAALVEELAEQIRSAEAIFAVDYRGISVAQAAELRTRLREADAGRPLGGMKDYLDSFETVEEALDNILEESGRYYQVVDRDTMETVREGLARFKNFTPKGFSSGTGS